MIVTVAAILQGVLGAAFGATVVATADPAAGEYCGLGYAITVHVSKPTSEYTIQYGESSTGPWVDQLEYTNACPSGRAMWYKVSATGYEPTIGSAQVTITPRELDASIIGVLLPSEDYVYDGTAKEPEASYADTPPAELTEDDFDTEYFDNVDAGTATVVYTGKNNYTGTVEDYFDILPASVDPSVVDPINPDPSDPYAPYSSYDATVMYDGQGHTINTQALYAVTLAGAMPSFSFSLESNGVYQTAPFVYTNIGEYVCWYKIEAENYKPFVHQAKLTILKTAYEDCCLTFTSTNAFTITSAWKDKYDGTLQISTELDVWSDWDGSPVEAGRGLHDEFILRFRGIGNSYVNGKWNMTAIVGTNVCCFGNIDVLLDYRQVAMGIRPKWRGDYWVQCFSRLFYNCAALTEAPDLPAEELAWGCYYEMFEGCTSLVSAPDLPAKTLTDWCYRRMFAGCTSLTNAPRIAATSSAELCCEEMFQGCTSLKVAPELKAMDTAYRCYYQMFADCASLLIPPILPATNIAAGAYAYTRMFDHCTNLSIYKSGEGASWQIPANAVTNAGSAYWDDKWNTDMFRGCNVDFDIPPVPGEKFYFMRRPITPSGPVDVDAPYSKYSIEIPYDGTYHSINTNELLASVYEINKIIWHYTEKVSNIWIVSGHETCVSTNEDLTFSYSLASNGVYQTEPFVFKDVVATSYWYKITSPGFADYVHEAQVVITNRPVTLTSASDSKKYDGTALTNPNIAISGLNWAVGEGATYTVTGSQTDVGMSTNFFNYTLNEGTKASNYLITKSEGTLTVTKGALNPEDDPGKVDPSVDPSDPGQIEDPTVTFSPWDYVGMYDGAAHTVDTNAMRTAYAAVVGEGLTVRFMDTQDGAAGVRALPPTFKDVVATSFWYKVSSSNYNDIIHPCKVIITNRCVTMKSADGTWVWDGKEHSTNAVTITIHGDDGAAGVRTLPSGTVSLIGDETVETTVCKVWSEVGVTPNDFSIAWTGTAKEANYNVTLVTGKLEIVAAPVTSVKVAFDALGGKIGIKSVVTQEVASVYGTLPVAVRENYLFQGWFLGVTNGAPQAVDGGALLAKGDHTLFAKWMVDTSVTPDPETIYKWEAIDANTARITGFKNSGQQIAKMIIPDTIGGRFVTEIAEKAFASAKCAATELTLPVYLTKIGDKAFTSIRTTAGVYSLKKITFASVRRWDDPTKAGTLALGAYAFSNATMLESLTLPAEVVSIGDYAFMNCRKMTSVTILGKPALGAMPFRSCGLDSGGVTVHIDPALASDADYMAKIKGGLPSVTVKTDAVITGLEAAGLALGQGRARLTLSVSRAASWGKVNASALKVEYRATLNAAPTTLVPTATENADGTVTLEVTVPQGSSGFLRVVGEGER